MKRNTISDKAGELGILSQAIQKILKERGSDIPDLCKSRLHVALDIAHRKLMRLMRQSGISLESELSA